MSTASAVVTSLTNYSLEPHVERALLTARAFAGVRPTDAGDLLRAAVILGAGKDGVGAFAHLASLLRPLAASEESKVRPKSKAALASFPLSSALADALSVAEEFLDDQTVSGRDYVTWALLADDPSLAEIASAAGSTIESLRNQWFRFVTSGSHQRGDRQAWERWWHEANVPLPWVADSAPLHIDNPEEVDRLGRRLFARSLAWRLERIRKEYGNEPADSSFILHLHAPWGAGKTTLLKLVQRELEALKDDPETSAPDWIVVDFNAWQQQWLDPPWWPLLNAVYLQSRKQVRQRHGLRRAGKLFAGEMVRRFFTGRKDLLLAAVIFFVLAALAFWVLPSDLMPSGTSLLAMLKEHAETVSAMLALIGTVLSAVLLMSRSLLSGSVRSARTFVEHASNPMALIRRHFRRLVEAVDLPICVMIDDMDRCRREYVVKLLEGIQTLFRDPRVFYVLAADRRWLHACFENTYQEFGQTVHEPGRRLGSLFLEKAVQLSVTVPRLSPVIQAGYWSYLLGVERSDERPFDELLREMRDELQDVDSQETVFARLAAEEPDPRKRQARQLAAVERLATTQVEKSTEYFLSPFAPLLEPNPRSMKRLLNAYALQRDLAVLGGLDVVDDRQRKRLALWTIVSLRWPLVEEYLLELAADARVPPVADIRALLDSHEVRDVLAGKGVDVELDLASVREFAALRGSESPAGAVA